MSQNTDEDHGTTGCLIVFILVLAVVFALFVRFVEKASWEIERPLAIEEGVPKVKRGGKFQQSRIIHKFEVSNADKQEIYRVSFSYFLDPVWFNKKYPDQIRIKTESLSQGDQDRINQQINTVMGFDELRGVIHDQGLVGAKKIIVNKLLLIEGVSEVDLDSIELTVIKMIPQESIQYLRD